MGLNPITNTNTMKQFFKFMFASALGFIVAGGILMLIFFISIVGIISSFEGSFSSQREVKVKEKTVLHLKLNQAIVDRAERNPFDDLDFGPFSQAGNMGLNTLLKSIEHAANDDKVKGIYLDLTSFPGGLGSLKELRDAIIDFKEESGKWVLAYSNMYSQGGYYLASAADKVYLYPEGDMEWKGLGTSIMFFKGMFDKLDIDIQVIRGGNNKFKSAVEPFIREDMSDANKEQTLKMLNSISAQMMQDISTAKGTPVDKLNLFADSLMLNSPDDAFALGFVDALKYRDEFMAELMDSVDVDKENKLNLISASKYYSSISTKKKAEELTTGGKESGKNKIAVIYAQGAIETGKGQGVESMGSETISKAIKKARKDSTVKAIVLRVNSPGGSALASDEIWRETVLAREVKPLVVTMGDVAASGGYYISAAADFIYAQPTTITGSIGVFGIIPNAQGFFNEKMGITFDGVQTHENAEPMGINRPLTDFERKKIEQSVERVYNTFLTRVSTGRNMSVEEVDAIGMGRIWSGTNALEIGLVDELGGLNDAIAKAAELAEVTDFEKVEFPKAKDPFEEFMKNLFGGAEISFLNYYLGDEHKYFKKVRDVKNLKGIRAQMPIELEVIH